MTQGRLRLVAAALALAFLPGCTTLAAHAAIRAWYVEAELPPERQFLDLPYRSDAAAHPEKHRLDLFLPDPEAPAPGGGWPVLVFVHGGGWTSGDRALVMGGADVYRNIGRFFASRGIATALVGYRLQPEVSWREQVRDVAAAVAWLRRHVGAYGGDPDALFLAGHSAGAHLAAWVALDPRVLEAARTPWQCVCGLVAVSNSVFDLTDMRTGVYRIRPSYFERRLRSGAAAEADWKQAASPARHVARGAPPALVLHAEDDLVGLDRQARLLVQALERAGSEARSLQVPDENHLTIVLALSRPESPATRSILDFVRSARCDPDPATLAISAPPDEGASDTP